MSFLNRVQVIGLLVKMPETRVLPSGRTVTEFTVLVERRWKDSVGEIRDDMESFSVEAWGRLSEHCQANLQKADRVFVEGRLQTQRWEDENGGVRARTKVVACAVRKLANIPEQDDAIDEEES